MSIPDGMKRALGIATVLSLVGIAGFSVQQKDAFRHRMVTESARNASDRSALEQGVGGSGRAGMATRINEAGCVPGGEETLDPCALDTDGSGI